MGVSISSRWYRRTQPTPGCRIVCSALTMTSDGIDRVRREVRRAVRAVDVDQPGHVQSDFGDKAAAGAARDYSTSLYAPIAEAIQMRAIASQHNATPAADFAKTAVNAILHPSPRRVITLGRGGRGL